MPPRPERIPDRHGWNGLHHYLNIHESNMEDLRSYLIDDDTDLRIHLLDVNHFRIEGRVYCRFGIYVDIRKTLELNDLNQARTTRYSYVACFEGNPEREIVRYDNAHPHEGHADEHHKHVFDPQTGRELTGSPFWVGRAGWPTLRQFFDEIYDWFIATGGSTPVPLPQTPPQGTI